MLFECTTILVICIAEVESDSLLDFEKNYLPYDGKLAM